MTSGPAQLRAEDLLEHAHWIRGLAASLVRDPGTADDLVQETWHAALLHGPRADRSLRPWLGRVLRNFARQWKRRSALAPHSVPLSEAAERESEHDTSSLVASAEVQSTLVQCVLELAEPHRSTVLLRYYEGLSAAQIAQRLGVPGATVRSRLRRALGQLRARLDEGTGARGHSWRNALAPLLTKASPFISISAQGTTLMKAKTVITVGLLAVLLPGSVWVLRHFSAKRESASAVRRPAVLAETAQQAAPPQADALHSENRQERRSIVASEAPQERPTWRGRLVDQGTGEALPSFQFEARQGQELATLETDVAGEFEATGFVRGSIAIRWIDDPGVPALMLLSEGREKERVTELEFDPDHNGVDIPIAVGPTYSLHLLRPIEVPSSALFATILSPNRGWDARLRLTQGMPLRSGNPNWVRFAPLETEILPQEPPWILEVSSRDGLVSGRAEVDAVVGIYPRPVTIELEARGRLRGRVTDTAGDPIPGARVMLQYVDGMRDGFWNIVDVEEDGSYAFNWLQPETYQLEATHDQHRPGVERPIGVGSLQDVERNFVLEPLALAGSIRGRLQSRTGAYRGKTLVVLEGGSGELPNLVEQAEWQSTARMQVGTFEFEDVPRGTYNVRIVTPEDQFAWQPREQQVTPPSESVEFLCLDDVTTRDLSFDVVDAESGEPIESFHLAYSVDGDGQNMTGNLKPGQAAIQHAPDEVALEWAIRADGYATQFGTEAAFRDEADGRSAKVALHPGWNARLRFVAPGSNEPRAGVEVRVDGHSAGTSASDGTLVISAAERPTTVDLASGEWSVVGTGLDAERLSWLALYHYVSVE